MLYTFLSTRSLPLCSESLATVEKKNSTVLPRSTQNRLGTLRYIALCGENKRRRAYQCLACEAVTISISNAQPQAMHAAVSLLLELAVVFQIASSLT